MMMLQEWTKSFTSSSDKRPWLNSDLLHLGPHHYYEGKRNLTKT
jgi:hypothetical protein